MLVYRIERQKYIPSTLKGIGAARSEGFRWNSLHTHMVYTSESRALAMLEVSVHLDIAECLPTDRVLVHIEIPDHLIIRETPLEKLPVDWDSKPPLDKTQLIGDAFIYENEAPVLKVPSAIIPAESNYLINPFHENAKLIKVIRTEEVKFDSRLFESSN